MELPRHDNRQVGTGGQPSTEEFRYRRVLDQNVRDLQSGKADAATTLAGYGITDAEKLGEVAGIVTSTSNVQLDLTHKGKTIELNNAGNIFLTIPANATTALPVGYWVNVVMVGAGQVFVSPAVGVTCRSYNSALKLAGQWAMATLYKRATNEWVAGGNLIV